MSLSGSQDTDFDQLLQYALSTLSKPHNYCGFSTHPENQVLRTSTEADKPIDHEHMLHQEKDWDSIGRSIAMQEVRFSGKY